MQINMKEWAKAIINSDKRVALPVMTYPGLAMVNGKIMEVIKDGQKQFECIKALSDKYPSAATVTIMDLSVEAEAFGSNVKYSEQDVPTVVGRIIEDEDSANALKVPNVGDGRTNVYLEAARIAAENIKDRPVLGGLIGPYSLSGRLFDMTEIMIAIKLEPELVEIVLEKCTQFLIEYAKGFKASGCNGIVIAEPAAGLLSPDLCQDFSSKYVQRIVSAVQDDNFMVILHNCGNTVQLVPSLLSTGAAALHFGNAVDMADILPQIPENIIAAGNVDPSSVFKNGTVDEMITKTTTLLEKMKSYKNFVLSSGCDVPPGTPIENVNAFYETLAQFNNK